MSNISRKKIIAEELKRAKALGPFRRESKMKKETSGSDIENM